MNKKKLVTIFTVTAIILLISVAIALVSGSYRISIPRLWEVIKGNGTAAENLAFFDIRLPRTCIALLVGIALAMSAVILQTVTKNALAEPGMIGINAGAALFVVLFLTVSKRFYYNTLSVDRILLMPVIAVLGGLLASLCVFRLSYKNGIKPVRLILVGIGINTGINAIITYIQLTGSKGDFNEVMTWTNGSLWGSSWIYVAMVSIVMVVMSIFIAYRAKALDALQLGDELATGLGVEVQKEMKLLYFSAAILASVATAVAGNIAFLGLLGAQIARALVGGRMRAVLPLSGMIGAVILILSDCIARNAFSPVELPVGIVVSMIGVPYFIYLMMKKTS